MDGLTVQYVPARVAGSTGGGTITTQDEGVTLSTTTNTINYTGLGIQASGAGAVATVAVDVLPPSFIEPNHTQRTFSSIDFFGTGYNASLGCNIAIGASTFAGAFVFSLASPLTASRRCVMQSPALVDTAGGFVTNSGVKMYRGNTAWAGGFECFLAWGADIINANSRFCFGLTDSSTIIASSAADPSAASSFGPLGGIYIAFDAADANFQIMTNSSNAAPATKTNTGISRFTANDWCRAWIWADTQASAFSVRLEKVTSVGTNVYTNTFSANIPAATTPLQATACLNTGPTVGSAVWFSPQKLICATYLP